MPNLSEYIVPSSDVQINMTFSGIPSMKLDTGSRLNWANSQSVQDIFAISHVDPIGIVALNATYTASVTMQSGEYNALMDAINAAAPAGQLYASMLEVAGFTLTCAYALKNAGTPKSAIVNFLSCRVSDVSGDVDANDPQTLVTISLRGTGIKRDVSPITV